MPHAYDDIPELAGIATYESAARVGYSVAENVRRLLHFHWTERKLMRALVARLPSMPIWEVKCAFALHQWQSVERIDALRERVLGLLALLEAIPDSGPPSRLAAAR